MTLEKFLGPTGVFGYVTLFLMGCFWFSATVFVLCIMEVGRPPF